MGLQCHPSFPSSMTDGCSSVNDIENLVSFVRRRGGSLVPSSLPSLPPSASIAVLFLAHDGVANPSLWEAWRRASGDNLAERIHFFIFRNERLSFPASSFSDTYDLGLRLPSAWCRSSTVHALMESLRAVLEQGPQSLQMVYVVSGRDVPLQPPAVLFSTQRTHTEGRSYLIHPGRSILCKAERRWQRALKSKALWPSPSPFEAAIRDCLVCHNTFLALSREHLLLLVSFPRDYPTHYKRLLSLGERRDLIPITCPEEWLVGTMLALQVEERMKKVLIEENGGEVRERGSKGRRRWSGESCLSARTDEEEEEEEEEEEAGNEDQGGNKRDARGGRFPAGNEREGGSGRGLFSPVGGAIDWPLTDQSRERLEDPSPLTWTSLTRERKRVFYSKTETRDWCLQQALEEGRANGHFFYRKVGSLGMSEGESEIKRKQDEEGGEKDEVVRLCELLYGVWDKGRGEKGNGEGEERGREVRRTEKRRRYHLRLPTKLCVGETCGRSRGNESMEWKGEKEEVDEMEVRAKRLEALSKGRR